MEWINATLSAQQIAGWEAWLEEWGFTVFLSLFFVEITRLATRKRLSWDIVGDSIASFMTLGVFYFLTYVVYAAAYVSGFYWVYLNFALMDIEVTVATVLLLVVLADLAYYWEHRFVHRFGIAWATHTVHHSSPHFNISVAYRFGPMDGIWPFFFHLPLALIGFDPILIFAAEAFVQLYQTVLHTELVRKLPRPIEAIFNTPSHHRVHHGSNPEYIDKNYGGILIVWDKLFGTFAEENATVKYGLTEPVNSNNPITVFFHGFLRLAKRFAQCQGLREKIYSLAAPPEWTPGARRDALQASVIPASVVLAAIFIGSTHSGVALETEDAQQPEATVKTSAEVLPGLEKAQGVVEDYYQAYMAGDEDAMYSKFTMDARFHYKMDFGFPYGSVEYSLRADEEFEEDEDLFKGYEPLEADFIIDEVRQTQGGATVDVTYKEAYRWDGYKGVMVAKERLRLEALSDNYYVVSLQSVQKYE